MDVEVDDSWVSALRGPLLLQSDDDDVDQLGEDNYEQTRMNAASMMGRRPRGMRRGRQMFVDEDYEVVTEQEMMDSFAMAHDMEVIESNGLPSPQEKKKIPKKNIPKVLLDLVKATERNDVLQITRLIEAKRVDIETAVDQFLGKILDLVPLSSVCHVPKSSKEKFNPFVAAASNETSDALDILWRSGLFPVKSTGSLGLPALLFAVVHQKTDNVLYLLKNASLCDEKDALHLSALHAACEFNNLEILRVLVGIPSVNLNVIDIQERTPLHIAAKNNFIDGIELLMDEGASFQFDEYGNSPITALYYAYVSQLKSKQSQNKKRKTKKRRKADTLRRTSDMILDMLFKQDLQPKYSAFSWLEDQGLVDRYIERLLSILTIEELIIVIYEDTKTHQIFPDVPDKFILAISRYWKYRHLPMEFEISCFERMVSLLSNECSFSTIESFASSLYQPQNIPFITHDVLSILSDELIKACRILLYGFMPLSEYSKDFVFAMGKAFVRLLLNLPIDTEPFLQCFDDLWTDLDRAISLIDSYVIEADRFSCLIYTFFIFAQTREELEERSNSNIEHLDKQIPVKYLESDRKISKAFESFCNEHRKALFEIVDQSESSLMKFFPFILRLDVFDVANKAFFLRSLLCFRCQEMGFLSTNRISASADILKESNEALVSQILAMNGAALNLNLDVSFAGEEGIGEGPLREILRQVFEYLVHSQSNIVTLAPSEQCFHLNLDLKTDESNIRLCKALGRVLGMSISLGVSLGVHFSKAMLKSVVLSENIVFEDLADFDPDLFLNLQKVMDNDFNNTSLDLTFEYFHGGKDIELKPKGAQIAVCNENKREYCDLYANARSFGSSKQLFENSAKSFSQVIPLHLIRQFSIEDISLLIGGPVEIDLEKMKGKVCYGNGLRSDDDVIRWLWEFIGTLDRDDMRKLVLFWTGSEIPHSLCTDTSSDFDYKNEPWIIEGQGASDSRLPCASTCAYTMRLPKYSSKQILEERFRIVLESGFLGFDKA